MTRKRPFPHNLLNSITIALPWFSKIHSTPTPLETQGNNPNDQCVDISPQAILGFNENCDMFSGTGCQSEVTFEETYNTGISHVMCKMTHMCLMLEEDELGFWRGAIGHLGWTFISFTKTPNYPLIFWSSTCPC